MLVAGPLLVALAGLGPIVQVAPPAGRGPAGHNAKKPSLCMPNPQFGVMVWEDWRCGVDPCVVASRVDASGTPRDKDGLLLSAEGQSPHVSGGTAADPGAFLVVWGSATDDVWGNLVRIDAGFTAPFPLFKGPGNHYEPAVATDGQKFLVVWAEAYSGPGLAVMGELIELDGGTSTAAQTLASASDSPHDVHVAWSGAEYLVTWTERAAVDSHHGIRVSPTGAPVGSAALLNTNIYTHDVGFAGQWVVGWETPGGDVVLRWLSPTLTGVGSDLQVNVPATNAASPSFASAGGRTWLAWSQSTNTVQGLELLGPSDSGVSGTLLSSATATSLSFAAHPTGLMLGVTGVVGVDSTVGLRPVAQNLQALGGQQTIDAAEQRTPDVAAIGDVYLVTWVEATPTGRAVMAMRLNRDGARLDAAPLVLEAGVFATTDFHDPNVVALGQEWLVVWYEANSDVARGRRVRVDGQLLDVAPLTLTPVAEAVRWPVVSTDGQQYLLVWQGDSYTMRAQRLSAQAQPLGVPLTLANANTIFLGPLPFGVGASDAGFLVTWHEQLTVQASRITSAGGLVDPVGGFAVFAGNQGYGQPSAAFDGQRFHVSASDALLIETALTGNSAVTPGGTQVMGGPGAASVKGGRLVPLPNGGLAVVASVGVANPGLLGSYRVAVSFSNDAGWTAPVSISEDAQQQAFAQLAIGSTSRMYVWAQHVAAGNGARVVARVETLGLKNAVCANGYECATGVCLMNECVGGVLVSDAGVEDGGVGDAGLGDGGLPPVDPGDGGAGTADGGVDARVLKVGCGCNSGAAPGLLGLLAVLALRRRQQRA